MTPTSPDVSQVIAAHLRDIPDFPVPGVVFKDLTPLLGEPAAFGVVVAALAQRHLGAIDKVAGIEARGFIFGAPVAHALGVGFVPVRKAGKLPGEVVAQTYDLEYGTATIEVHADAVCAGERVLLIDDLLATGGTADAAWDLLEGLGATVRELAVLVELSFLHGRSRLGDRAVHALHVV